MQNKLIQLRVKPELWQQIKDAAKSDRRTMTQWIRIAIEDKLDELARPNNPNINNFS